MKYEVVVKLTPPPKLHPLALLRLGLVLFYMKNCK